MRFGSLVLATFAAVSTMPSPAGAQFGTFGDRGTIDVQNVSRVDYPGGWFAETRRGVWTEYATGGAVKSVFEEVGRDREVIDLDSAARDVQIRIDIKRGNILITERRGAFRPLYRISRTGQAGGGGPGTRANEGWGSFNRERFIVEEREAGPIWNQGDANAKCAALARRENAEWTGQWRTTQVGVMSVCELRSRR